jgi:hypothetical protein
MRRNPEALIRSRTRKSKDDTALRLNELMPELRSLKLEISEVPDPAAEEREAVSYRKHIIVDRAPARFELPCHDHKCNGAHNITAAVLQALKRRERCVEGSDRCQGETKHGACPYEMQYVVVATWAS